MKKNKKVFIISISIILAIITILIFFKINKKDGSDNMVIASLEYSNFAWAPTYYGTAILNDGSIYTWEFSKNTNKEYLDYVKGYELDNENGFTKFVLDKGSKSLKKVSRKDLDKIIDLKNNLTNKDTTYEVKCPGADMGSKNIYIFKNKSKLSLKESGDCNGNSTSKNALELIDLIEKYE